jgi:hypothetical protein
MNGSFVVYPCLGMLVNAQKHTWPCSLILCHENHSVWVYLASFEEISHHCQQLERMVVIHMLECCILALFVVQ